MIPRILGLLLCGATLPLPASAYTASEVENGGTVAGVVKFADEYPARESMEVDRDQEACGTEYFLETFLVDPETKGLRNVVVTLLGIESGKPLPDPETLILNQEGCRYRPHLQIGYLPAAPGDGKSKGLELRIENSDEVFHNVHTRIGEKKTTFNIPSLPGSKAKKRLPAPGTYQVTCDLHAWMSAWIVVVDHPYVAVSAADGTFEITDVPPGTYQVTLWHEGLGSVQREVVVEPGGTSALDLVIGGE